MLRSPIRTSLGRLREIEKPCCSSRSQSSCNDRVLIKKRNPFRDYFLAPLSLDSLRPETSVASKATSGFKHRPQSKIDFEKQIPEDFRSNTDEKLTAAQISLRKAKRHFGAVIFRGNRLLN
ncbi:hypothetical protein N7450_011689 [Penicillium hetheringtonii]|uniref:Uncharacterized protein n=1 Tax=Penicillium hetheringtonii TaxID=911720 RepID=A0AAD6DAN5_9EURO|nr:hypothetical protein N7450_011689 [Penicillium hetheringtonii]